MPSPRNRTAPGPADGLTFASSVDYDTGFARQNPLGAVAAYAAAFSPLDGHRLVIDTHHADRYPEEHARLLGAAGERPDVEVLERTPWSAAEGDRLLAEADCYLSLHRADGGLGAVAKAMSWGTLTVVTATPGSLEFQTEWDSGLVRADTTPVPADEYRYPPGSEWAEPDLQHATSVLRAVVAEPEATAAKVRLARQVAARRFSRTVATAAVRSRLADIDSHRHAGHRGERVRLDRVQSQAAARR
jgi:hypothetical protein